MSCAYNLVIIIHSEPFPYILIEIDEILVEILRNMIPEECVVIMYSRERKCQSILNYITYYVYNNVSKLHAVRSHHDYRPQKRQDKK